MPGIITDIKYQKRDKNQVNIFIDGEYSFSVSLLAAECLNTGQALEETEIKNLRREYEQRIAYNQSIKYLARSPRSSTEVIKYLRRKGCGREISIETVSLLKEKKYINDKEFARIFVENRERFSPRSRFALGGELRQKGIDVEIIDNILTQIDENISAWNAIESKIYNWRELSEDRFKLKFMGFLKRRGFNYEISKATYEKALKKLNSIDD